MSSAKAKTILKIDGVPSNFSSLPFRRQLEYRNIIQNFKDTATKGIIYAKGIPLTKAFNIFKKETGQ